MNEISEFRTEIFEISFLYSRCQNWSQLIVVRSAECGLQMENELRVGKILKQLMNQQAKSLVSISKETGVPKSTISEWLNNRAPNPTQAVKVANCLGVRETKPVPSAIERSAQTRMLLATAARIC